MIISDGFIEQIGEVKCWTVGRLEATLQIMPDFKEKTLWKHTNDVEGVDKPANQTDASHDE